MTETEETVLVRELGKLAGFFGGGFGARFAARRLPVEESEASLGVPGRCIEIRNDLSLILQSVGKLTDEFASEIPGDSLSALIGSGHMNLNPTIVHVRIVEKSDGSTLLLFRALAKEGLVKQRSAERAIERITALVSSRYAEQALGADSP